MKRLNRRHVVVGGVASVCSAGLALARIRGANDRRNLGDRTSAASPVAIIKSPDYSVDLEQRIIAGIRACGLEVKGKRVLLKPNLVEFEKDAVINTNVSVVAATLEAFRSMGAAEVRIGEGPGHRRDAIGLAEEAGYRSLLPKFDETFVDLNRDDVSLVEGFAGEPGIYLPNSGLRADLVVSIPKMKTHHWAGVTLSMKNYFGLVPGAVYGWPKNTLHMLGISRSIMELNRIFSKSFAIVDGIVGMEGNGPVQGTAKPAGVLVMGGDLRAVDATCCRLMGVDPGRVEYLAMSSHLGNATERGIEHRGESPGGLRTNFRLIREFEDLRLES